MAERKNNDIRERVRAALSVTPECLSPRQLEALFVDDAADEQAAEHVHSCLHCQAELRLLRAFEDQTPLPEEGAAVSWIAAQLSNKADSVPSRMRGHKSLMNRLFGRMPKLAYAVAAIAALAVGVGVYDATKSVEPGLQVGHGAEATYRSIEVRALMPIGDVKAVPDGLKWESSSKSSKYAVKIMEVDRTILWSAECFDNFVTLPADVKSKITDRKPILWQVEALDSSGKIIATSPPARFRVVSDLAN
jgi:hypothetical protein